MSLKNKFFKYFEKLNYHSVLKNLVSHGLQINVVYDIGAHKGRWTKEHAKKLKSRGYRTFNGVLS